jgi:hypothetical protein
VRVLEFFMGCFAAQAYMEWADRPISARERRTGSVALWSALVFLVIAGFFYVAVFNLPVLNAYTQFSP